MKVRLIKHNNLTVGWTIEGENEEEMRIVGSIRNMCFFGMGENAIKYAGVKSYPRDERYAEAVAWIQRGMNSEFTFSKLDDDNNLIINDVKTEE